jgi:hypothetical protein
MTALSPVAGAFCPLVYHTGIGALVLIDTGNYPATVEQAQVLTYKFVGANNWSLIDAVPYGTGVNNPTPRMNTSAAYDGTNVMLFAGQSVPGTELMNDVWTLNSSGVWSNPIANYNATTTTIRSDVYLATMTGGVAVWGGTTLQFSLQDQYFWNGTTMAAVSPATVPPIRVGAGFDSNKTNTAILFGGANESTTLGDTWKWNATTWSQLTTTGAPSYRYDMAFAYDNANNNWVLFGGTDGHNTFGDTYTFDGVSTWTKKTPTVSPSYRIGASMASDIANGWVTLWGGFDGHQFLNDTWRWNPAGNGTWTQL